MKRIQRLQSYRKAAGFRVGILIVLSALLISSLLNTHPAAAQGSDPITGYGTACADIQSNYACFDFELTFIVIGGDVSAVGFWQQQITENGVTVQVTANVNFSGTFEGGDGGSLFGNWDGEYYVELPEGESYTEYLAGTWEGNLYADGTGTGTWSGDYLPDSNTWNISFSAAAFQAGLPAAPTETPEATAAPNPTATQPLPTAAAPLTATSAPNTGDTPGSAPPSEGSDPALETEAAEAARDTLNALAGGAAGTLLGSVLALLANRANQLADSGADLADDLQSALKELQAQGDQAGSLPTLSRESVKKLGGILDSIQADSKLAGTYQGKLKKPEGMLDGAFRKLTKTKDSAYQKLGETMNYLSIGENLAKLRGMEFKALKKLGPLSFGKNFYDRAKKLLKERGDEPLHYKASTILEAGLVEGLKTISTANPYIFLTDQAVGQAGGKPPSDYVADKSHTFIQRYYMKVKEKMSPDNISDLEYQREMRLQVLRDMKKEVEEQVKNGELSREAADSRIRAWVTETRQQYHEISGKLNRFTASFGD